MSLSIAELRKIAVDNHISEESCSSKQDLQKKITEELYKSIDEYESQITHHQELVKGLTNKANGSIDIIRSICEHQFYSESPYGDRTHYICSLCGKYK